MTTEEKLERFQAICTEDARAQYEALITTYRKGLETSLLEHKKEAEALSEERIKAASEEIQRKVKKELSMDQMKLRRDFAKQQEALREALFSEVLEKLSTFRKSEEYLPFLLEKVNEVKAAAGDAAYEIYIDGGDEALLKFLPNTVRVGSTPFIGGIIGVIPSRNMVIDHSFRTRMEEEKKKFSFEEGGAYGTV